MNRYRKTIVTTGPLLALVLGLPASAPASSLLSGYGGPGQGSQAILGSALINGPGGGSAGGGSGSSSASSPTTTQGSAPAGGGQAGGSHGGGSSAQRAGGGAAGGGSAAAVQTPLYPLAERGGESSTALGLTGDDLLYILLAIGLLAGTGALTWRLGHTRAPRPGG